MPVGLTTYSILHNTYLPTYPRMHAYIECVLYIPDDCAVEFMNQLNYLPVPR
jgi:hypothetical protein